jgi:hypothetical protein
MQFRYAVVLKDHDPSVLSQMKKCQQLKADVAGLQRQMSDTLNRMVQDKRDIEENVRVLRDKLIGA